MQWSGSASEWMRRADDALRGVPGELYRFGRYLVDRFIEDGCLNSAAMLAYTTLLSLVPLFTVMFSVFTAFPVFDEFSGQMTDWLFRNLVPAASEVVQEYIERFADRAAGLTAAGMFGVIVAAVLMMSSIDQAMNQIWRVTKRRHPIQRIMVYWTVITIGPFLLGISLVASSYVIALAEFADVADTTWLQHLTLELTPFVAIVLAFTFLYAAVPNRRVPVMHAVGGAVFAAVLFEIAKRGFAIFVTNVPTYEVIYGALAALPIFLVWIFVCWVVVLLGAEFTQAIAGYRQGRTGALSDSRMALVLAVRLAAYLWEAQRKGGGLTREELLAREPEADDAAIQDALNALYKAGAARRTEEGAWILARDPSRYTLRELYDAYPFVLTGMPAALGKRDGWNRALADTLDQACAGADRALERTLKSIFEAAPDSGVQSAESLAAIGDETGKGGSS